MKSKSSLFRFLPPALWENLASEEAVINTVLCIAEKILFGAEDGQPITHQGHVHQPIAEIISNVHRLFDPWGTSTPMLPTLASWVGLDLSSDWSEYQCRKIIGDIVQNYQWRGRKDSLYRYLDLYTIAEKRPRIAIDDGSRILYCRPSNDGLVSVDSLLSTEPLLSPLCIAAAPDGSLFVGEEGFPNKYERGVYRISGTGMLPYQDGAVPHPIGSSGFKSNFPVAIAIDGKSPGAIYYLDWQSRTINLWRFSAANLSKAPDLLADAKALGAIWPVAMVFDPSSGPNGRLFILDRGIDADTPARSFIIEVLPGSSPLTIIRHDLKAACEPLSLCLLSSGDLIVGDAPDTGDDTATSANFIYVKTATWTVVTLKQSAATGSVVAPKALIALDSRRLLVLDVGLKPYWPIQAEDNQPYLRKIARSAQVLRLDVNLDDQSIVAVNPVEQSRRLVSPTGMAIADDVLYITDAGEDPAAAYTDSRPWRQLSHEFGIAIHFRSGSTTKLERQRIVQSIRTIVDVEKPAHTYYSVVYAE